MKPFKGINHGKGQIDLTHKAKVVQLLPTEIHLKEDGALGDKPCFAIVMEAKDPVSGIILVPTTIVGQLSLDMLNEGLADIGYQIVPKT